MSQRLHHPDISVADYLLGEHDAEVRHEYIDGQVYAMAGASDRHNRIALNLASRLHERVEGGACNTFMSDMKLYVAPNLFYYPDVMVTCDPPGADPYFRTEPVLIIEVVSPSTRRVDLHEKLPAYTSIPTLREYVMIQQDQTQIEVHRVSPEGWVTEVYREPEDSILFDSVGLSLTVADIYRNVRFEVA